MSKSSEYLLSQWELERNKRRQEAIDLIAQERPILREKLLIDMLLHDDSNKIIEAEFDGYGDSGTVHCDHQDSKVVSFMENIVDYFVQYDWYNGEGGGGTVTWNLVEDKITIQGHVNVIETVPQDDVEL